MSGKHTPFTSEPSHPHTSEAEPETHVDILHFGEGGEKDDSLTVPHVTDPGAVAHGEEIKELREEQKEENTEDDKKDE